MPIKLFKAGKIYLPFKLLLPIKKCFFSVIFLPAAKPSGLRTLRVVVVVLVVVVGGQQFVVQLPGPLLSCSPTLNFLWGGICDSKIRFLFRVGSVTQKLDFSLGWDPSMACSLCNSVQIFFAIFFFLILSMSQVLKQSLFLFPCEVVI